MYKWGSKIKKSLKRTSAIWSKFDGFAGEKKVKSVVKIKVEEKVQVKVEKQDVPKPALESEQSISAAKTPKQDILKAKIALCVKEIDALKVVLSGPNPLLEQLSLA